jgi:uncharacterized protein YjbI with pentapeptide repeats
MASEEHVAILRQGSDIWNSWRRSKPTVVPDLGSEWLSGLDFSGFNLSSANLSYTLLDDANLRETDLRSANLTHTDFRGAYLVNANLKGAQLRGAYLSSADLSGAALDGARIHGAHLRRTLLINTDLSGANLSDADLNGALLRAANLCGTCLRRANLCGAEFSHSDLASMDLRYAALGYTTFGNCDLSKVEGLDCVDHRAPSSIGIDTIYLSRGRVPETFLRGCGVPENLIRYVPSLVNSEEGIRFYSCFISHSSNDEEFARRLRGRMRDAHLRVWFAPEDIQGGQKLHEQIETAIRVYDKLLIVLSEASLRSEWVMTELRKARKAELQSGKRKLFPVRLVDFDTLRDWECFDADSGKDLAVELREYFIPDFSHWKDQDSFEGAFARLLKDLKAEACVAGLQ